MRSKETPRRHTPCQCLEPRDEPSLLGKRDLLLARLCCLRSHGGERLDIAVVVVGGSLPLSPQRLFRLVELFLSLRVLLLGLGPPRLSDLLHLPGLDHLGLDLAFLFRLDNRQDSAHTLL